MVGAQGDLGAEQALEQLVHLADHVGQLDDFGLQRLLPAEGEQLPREAGGAVRVGLDLLDVVVVAVARHVAQQHEIAIADDRGQHVVEVVRHAAGQLPDRLHLGGLRDLPLEPRLLGRVGQAEQHRRLAQPAHAGQAEAHRLLRVAAQPHGDIAARGGALPVAAHRIGHRGLVRRDDEVGRVRRDVLAFRNTGGVAKCRVGEQEMAVAVGHRQPDRQLFEQRLELRGLAAVRCPSRRRRRRCRPAASATAPDRPESRSGEPGRPAGPGRGSEASLCGPRGRNRFVRARRSGARR